MIFIIIGSLFAISFLWAVYSMFKEEKTHSQITHVKSELQKEKILFRK